MDNMRDSEITYIEDDIKKVQIKTNLFVQNYGDAGVFHLFKEGVQNGIDEYIDPDCIKYLQSIGEMGNRIISIEYDQLTDYVSIEDNGRGIPETKYPIDIVCTKLQSGSKFYRNQGGSSSGEFGVGLTVVCALSSEFKLATYRKTYSHEIRFKDGIKVEDNTVTFKRGSHGKKHGTIVGFSINPIYMGKGSHLPMNTCKEWMEEMSYQVPEGIEFHVREYNGLELVNEQKIKKKPFSDLIYLYVNKENLLNQPISINGNGFLEEEIAISKIRKDGQVDRQTSHMKKNISLEFAFAYNNEMENNYQSFCNFTKTEEHGVHVDAVEESLCRYLQTATLSSMTEGQKAKWDITKADVKAGLQLVINLSTNAQVQFMGNAKNKIQNQDLKPVLKEITRSKIEEYFKENQSKLTQIVKIIIQNARTRIEIQKQKITGIVKKVDPFRELDIPCFTKANNPGKDGELYLVEGQRSAFGSLIDGRDTDKQAIFGFRGVTLNVFKWSFAEVMANEEWKNYVNVLHTGIGPSFDIRRCPYKRIFISTDADIDGAGISVGIAGFHVKHMPQIIENKMLYKVYPPLYYITDPANPFIRNKGELTEIYLKKIEKNYKIRLYGTIDGSYLSKDDFWVFLYDTIDYNYILNMANEYCKVDKRFIEIVAAALIGYNGVEYVNNEWKLNQSMLTNQKFISNFMKFIQEVFPEVLFSGNKVEGVANGRTVTIHLNNVFVRKIEDLIPIFRSYGCYLGVKEKHCEERKMTIGEFLDDTCRLLPQIITRYKGLGEANAEQIWETTLNPQNRIAVLLTFDNIERDYEIFMKLKSDRPSYQKQRKAMVEAYKIGRSDLDT